MSENPSVQPSLSGEQYQQLVGLLKEVDPVFPLGSEIFDQVVRISPFLALEFIGGINLTKPSRQFLLAERPEDDLGWPGQWAIAGTVLRASDGTRLPLNRLMRKELRSIPIESLSVVGAALVYGEGGRAPSVSIITSGELKQGGELDDLLAQDGIDLFPSNQLPEKMIKVHKLFTEMASQSLSLAHPQGVIGLLARTLDQSSRALRRLENGSRVQWLTQDQQAEFPPLVIMADPDNTTRISLS